MQLYVMCHEWERWERSSISLVVVANLRPFVEMSARAPRENHMYLKVSIGGKWLCRSSGVEAAGGLGGTHSATGQGQ